MHRTSTYWLSSFLHALTSLNPTVQVISIWCHWTSLIQTSQVAASCVAGAAHAALQLLQSPQSVRQRAAELVRELLPGIASAPDESVFNAFAKVRGRLYL
jgi:hypothetical protein